MTDDAKQWPPPPSRPDPIRPPALPKPSYRPVIITLWSVTALNSLSEYLRTAIDEQIVRHGLSADQALQLVALSLLTRLCSLLAIILAVFLITRPNKAAIVNGTLCIILTVLSLLGTID